MNTVVTSREDILKTSRELIQRQGWSAINIRSVAAACEVSVGSICNYFDSKAALSVVHTHYFLLGMMFFLLLLVLEKNQSSPFTGTNLA